MRSIKRIFNDLYKQEMFAPGFIGLFINPFYLARKFLHASICNEASQLTGKLLDLGCGSKPYQGIFKVSEYIGLELDDGRDQSHNMADRFYDGKTIPFPDNCFDCVFSSQVFEHIFNLEDIIKELHRVLKPGGTILVTLPFAWPEHEQPWDFARYTSFGIEDLFHRNGFDVDKIVKTGNYPVALCQLWAAYISAFVLQKPTLLKLTLTLVFISPINLAGWFFALKKNGNDSYYLDNVVLAYKLPTIATENLHQMP